MFSFNNLKNILAKYKSLIFLKKIVSNPWEFLLVVCSSVYLFRGQFFQTKVLLTIIKYYSSPTQLQVINKVVAERYNPYILAHVNNRVGGRSRMLRTKLLLIFAQNAGDYSALKVLSRTLKKLQKKKRISRADDYGILLIAYNYLLLLLSHTQERQKYSSAAITDNLIIFGDPKDYFLKSADLKYDELLVILRNSISLLDLKLTNWPTLDKIFSLLNFVSFNFIDEQISQFVFENENQQYKLLKTSSAQSLNELEKIARLRGNENLLEVEIVPLLDWAKNKKINEKFSQLFDAYSFRSQGSKKTLNLCAKETRFSLQSTNGRACQFFENGAIGVSEHLYDVEDGSINAKKVYLIEETLNVIPSDAHLFLSNFEFKDTGGTLYLNVNEKFTMVNRECILLPGKGWSFYHWISETLPSLILVDQHLRESVKSKIIYLPFSKQPWHDDWLQNLGLSHLNIVFIEDVKNVLFTNATFATLPSNPLLPSRAILLVRERIKGRHLMFDSSDEKTIIVHRKGTKTARHDRSFVRRHSKKYKDAFVTSFNGLGVISQLALASSYYRFIMEGGAENMVMTFTKGSEFEIDATLELYYETFAALAAITENKINYNFEQGELYLASSQIWNFAEVK